MSDTVGAKYQRLREYGQLVEIAVIILMVYVVFMAPAMIFRGETETLRDAVAGILGSAFWVALIGTAGGVI